MVAPERGTDKKCELPISFWGSMVARKLALSQNSCKRMTIPAYLRAQPDGALLSVKVQPRASSNEIGKEQGGELKVKVTAPPVDSAANEALVRFLAEELGCPRNRVELVRGQTSKHKVIKLYGLSPEAVLARLGGG